MKKILLLLSIVILIPCRCWAPVQGGGIVNIGWVPESGVVGSVPASAVGGDVSYGQSDNDIDAIGDVGGTEYRHAQKIVLALPTTIDKIACKFDANVGDPAGSVTLRVETNGAGDSPSGTLAHASATLAITAVASTTNTWDYTNFTLAAGTYWAVMQCDDQAASQYWKWRMQTGLSNGARSTDGGTSWILLGDREHNCYVYAE